MAQNNNSGSSPALPSLFVGGETATSVSMNNVQTRAGGKELLDLLYDGFYLVFLLRSGYSSKDADKLKTQIRELLTNFERQAKRLDYSTEDIHQAKYAYCALVDETIMTQHGDDFVSLQNNWAVAPLQLTLFGSQLAGEQFFTTLEDLRAQGAARLPSLEVFYYCLLLGFQGKYRLEAAEKINYLISRLGDEITFLKGKKSEFAPFWAIPDKVRHALRGELPLAAIVAVLAVMGCLAFAGLTWMLKSHVNKNMNAYNNLITTPEQQANVTIYLP